MMDRTVMRFLILGLQLLRVHATNTTGSLKNRRQGNMQFRSNSKEMFGQMMPPAPGQGMHPGGPPPGEGMYPGGPPPRSNVGHVNEAVMAVATRFTRPTYSTKKFQRSTPKRVSFKEDCDYLAHYCLKAYDTGKLCGRTLYYKYFTFKNYCLLDYVNCMERYELWQVVHMGECFTVKELTEYVLYPYDDDFFLDQYYIIEDN